VIYVQDYGAPVGWRLRWATRLGARHHHPERQRLRSGLRAGVLGAAVGLRREATPANESRHSTRAGVDAIRWQYTHGVSDPTLVSPDTWLHDHALVSRPGNDRIS